MAHVITQPCIDCKDQSCVTVCPVGCIHPGVLERAGGTYDQFLIDPEACICCGLCEPECPVDAIFPEDEVPIQWSNFIQINVDFFKQPK